jgi:putative tryptophan/tyrosine transport system substrate-binding protein
MKYALPTYFARAGNFSKKCVILASICLLVGMGAFCQAEETREPKKITILISRNIRPYLQAVEGFKRELKKEIAATFESYSLNGWDRISQKALTRKITGADTDLVLAVGPEARQFLWAGKIDHEIKKVYAMVLNPPGPPSPLCGISLDIPVSLELKIIKRAFPSVYRLGILYDPSHNERFVHETVKESRAVGLKIVPLEVSSKRAIPSVLSQQLPQLDGLWLIPDPTVISESLVRFLIKDALSERVAVIGYNRFFYRSGAALSFILKYEQIGEQAARLSMRLFSGKQCASEMPSFRTWLNLKVINALGIPSVTDSSLGIEAGP